MGRPATPPKHLVAQRLDHARDAWLREWRDAARRTGSSTPESKAVIINTVVDVLGAARQVWTLTSGDFQRAMHSLKNGADEAEQARRRQEGRRSRRGRTTVGSISAAALALRQFAEYCHNQHWLSEGITLKKEQFKVHAPQTREGVLAAKYTRIPEAEWSSLLETAERIHPRCRMTVALGLYCGRRVSEVVRLQWRDINWDTEEIYFYNQKRLRWLTVPLFPQIREEFEHWRRWVTEKHGIPQPDWFLVPNRVPITSLTNVFLRQQARKEPWLWPLDMHIPSRIETVQSDVRRLCDKLGLGPGENTHTFRRSSAKVIAKKFGLTAAQALLDHQSVVTTQRYTGNEDGQEALRDALMSGNAFPKNVTGIPDNVRSIRKSS